KKEEGPPPDNVAPPEKLVGTMAFKDYAGVMTLTFENPRGLDGFSTRAVYDIKGTIQYLTAAFEVMGTYNGDTGNIEASASAFAGGQTVSFTISGVYSEAMGFNGTIQRIAGGVTESGYFASLPAASTVTYKLYLGYFGGAAQGTWNMTVINEQAMGTYSGQAPGQTGPEDIRGYLKGYVSGNSITLTDIVEHTGQSVGTGAGEIISGSVCLVGTWSTTATGYWSGAETDSIGNPHPDSSSDPSVYLFAKIAQTTESVANKYPAPSGDGYYPSSDGIVAINVTNAYPYNLERVVQYDFIQNFSDGITGYTIKAGSVMVWNESTTSVYYTDMNLTFTGGPITQCIAGDGLGTLDTADLKADYANNSLAGNLQINKGDSAGLQAVTSINDFVKYWIIKYE
ncbi:MAG: hypothetical protein AB1798_22705, partial [Spirochaetota bacterium]